jgi:L-alanine-DL-glutamate epimerase-like enolase superfamily enzyme
MSAAPKIVNLEAIPLNVPLLADFAISSSTLQSVSNIAVRIELGGGTVGWGETPILAPLTAETQSSGIQAIGAAASLIRGQFAGAWRLISELLLERFPNYPSVRAGIEMALFDALARYRGMPLYEFFGGSCVDLKTDITIPICSSEKAFGLAREYRLRGFEIVKVKVGQDPDEDFDHLCAIREGFPECRLLLDANCGFDADEMIDLVDRLTQSGMKPVLIEQPVARDDLAGLRKVGEKTGIPVAADESCVCARDAMRIVGARAAQVINIKLVKSGVVEALDIASVARSAGLDLMIGGMVETRIGMGFAAHFAAGIGQFKWIDLDTPLLLAEDPVDGGYRVDGARYILDTEQPGHGGRLRSNRQSRVD